jgi:DNA-binding LacI/PurR family transcriptional regulator
MGLSSAFVNNIGRSSMLRYKEIKNILMAEIAKMNINAKLPSRPALCKKLGVANATLDKAINELVAEELLVTRKGDGTYVAGGDGQLAIHAGQTWGVIIRDVRESFFAEIVRGVEDVAQSHGINIILCNSDYDLDKQEQYIKRLSHSGVSGIIIVPVANGHFHDNYRLYNQLNELKVPVVYNVRDLGEDALVVTSNNFYGGYIATKHLLGKGYRHIAYISNVKYRTSVERCQGYITALLENGIKVNYKIIIIEEQLQAQPLGYEAMKQLLASGQKVDAVFCLFDQVVKGVYQAIIEAGLAVSDDIGVVGYDNSNICKELTPAVTSVDYKALEMGTKMAEVLYKQLNKEDLSDFQFHVIQPDMVVRDSCLGPKKEGVKK